MGDMKIESMERFGPEFQSKVISALIQDVTFLQRMYDIVDANYFESDARRWIVRTILNYYKDYRSLPTSNVFRLEVDKISSEVLQVAVKHELKTVAAHISDKDLEYVKNKFLEFCQNQTMKAAILQSVELLEVQDYDEIKVRIDKARRAGQERNYGHDWKKDIDERLIEKSRDVIPTPWDCLNKLMDGGLAPGELGVVAAPSGAGKSWMLAKLGASALKAGKRVVHYTLELNDHYTGLRYDTIFTGIEPKELKNHYDQVKSVVEKVPGEIIIKYYPSETINSHALLAHIHQLEAIDARPDLIVVDYGDLLRSNSKADARYLELGYIYRELRSLAGELEVPIWTASQTQRSSIDEEIIQADKIAESYGKIMVADFVISLSRTLNDKVADTARVHVIKNRFGVDGITFPAYVSPLKGKIEVYDENSPEGQKMRQSMNNSETVVKKQLKDILDQKEKRDTAELG